MQYVELEAMKTGRMTKDECGMLKGEAFGVRWRAFRTPHPALPVLQGHLVTGAGTSLPLNTIVALPSQPPGKP